MKNLIIVLLGITLSISVNAQRQTIDATNFDNISFGVPGTLYVTQGSKYEVVIEADDDTMEKIEVVQTGNKLKIKSAGNSWWGNWNSGKVTVYVTSPNINGISVSGSGNVESRNTINSEKVRLDISGSGSMELDLKTADLDLNISGSGSLSLKGSGQNTNASISGSGKIRAQEFTTDVFKASISGSGSCYVHANKEIDASISGSGSVYYTGRPDKINSKSSGSGKIKSM